MVARLVSMIFLFFIAQVALLVGLRLVYPGERPDVFAPYDAMLPGQAIAEADAPCHLQTVYTYAPTTVCRLSYGDGIFTSIDSIIFQGRVVSTTFVSSDLHLGDIIRHWGRPDSVGRLGVYLVVRWDDQRLYGIITPVVVIEPFSYIASVESLTVTSPDA
jgi:hypothetical protein